jgi:hypothetical protein
MLSRSLTVRDIKLRVFVVAKQLGESYPKGNHWDRYWNGFTSTGRKEKL